MSTKIFISYSHIDEEFAKELEQILKEIGIQTSPRGWFTNPSSDLER